MGHPLHQDAAGIEACPGEGQILLRVEGGKQLEGFVDGSLVKKDPRRGRGIWANELGVIFNYNGNRIMSVDPTTGTPNFMYSRIKVEKA